MQEPYDKPPFYRAVGETFFGGTGSFSKEQIQQGAYDITLGHLAFATYKVNSLISNIDLVG